MAAQYSDIVNGRRAKYENGKITFEYLTHTPRPPLGAVDRIIKMVADDFGVSVEDIKSKTRKAPIAQARQVSLAVCRHVYGKLASYTWLASKFKLDHTTIIYACERVAAVEELNDIANRIAADVSLRDDLQVKYNFTTQKPEGVRV